jgi:asparagine synthase (glutamine-hydrolysing)
MCGICGIFESDPVCPVLPETLERMNCALTHRGPDDAGYHFEPGLGLGHRRLSIIDLSTGQQPMTNEDGTVWIVFNGEIYNFPELRNFLIGKGHQFRTHSDTETIVHLYEELGEDWEWIYRSTSLLLRTTSVVSTFPPPNPSIPK